MLPRFPDETDSLPQFTLDATSEHRALGPADLELIDEEPSAAPSIMPVALDASDLEDDLGEEEPIEELELPRRKLPWRGIAFAAAAVVGLGVILLGSSASRASETSAVAAELPPLPKLAVELPPPPVAALPPAIVEPPPAPPMPTTGTLIAPAWTKGRRVWIDGKAIAGHAPKLEAACGKHTVKVGAYGKTRKVDILCGGETKVTP